MENAKYVPFITYVLRLFKHHQRRPPLHGLVTDGHQLTRQAMPRFYENFLDLCHVNKHDRTAKFLLQHLFCHFASYWNK
jgi:hypothetical protein